MKKEISRRSFLEGLAVGGTSIALTGMTGCTPDTNTPQSADAKQEDWAQEVDLLICGGGGAGMACAIEAKDNGVETVLIIEKLANTGGTTTTSQGMIAGYDTQIQKKQSIALAYDEMYANLMSNASYRLDPVLAGITVEKSGETIDWLIDRVQVPFKDEVIVGYGPLQMMHLVEDGGVGFASAFAGRLDELGVAIETGVRLTEIILDAEGRVAGAVVRNGSNIQNIKTKAIMVATGGYSYNPELTARLDPEKAGTFGIGYPGSEGEGIVAASNIGAALSHTNDMMCVLKDYVIMSEHEGTSASANVNGFTNLANMILVGAEGTRFCNEGSKGFMTQNLNSPVFDQMHRDGKGYVWMISDQTTVNATEGRTYRGEELDYITGDDASSFAQALGVDAVALAATIESYNNAVATGFDAQSGRVPTARLEAPYAALPVVPCEIITYGGIARNIKGEVIRADDTAIPGLFVAGEASCNSAYMGFTLSNCFTWGRIGGKNAALYIAAR
jgi:fumarate reductase flavoprotein subunit